jgi:hypothetical protein
MQTLWDIMTPRRRAGKEPVTIVAPSRARPVRPVRPVEKQVEQNAANQNAKVVAATPSGPVRPSAQDRYETMTRAMLARYGVRVRKWRSGMSGVAWQVTYRDGTVSRLIESPRPKGPMSAAVFLHEIGHHAIGFSTYRPRCLEEFHAWKYAIEQMEAWELNVTQRVHDRMYDSLHYAVEKARRRGLKELPVELRPYERARPGRGPGPGEAFDRAGQDPRAA